MTITLRKRKLKKGRIKLYLDIYKGYTKSEDGKILYFKREEVVEWMLSNRRATNIELDELASTHISIA